MKEIPNAVCDKTIGQPTSQTVRDSILLTQGPVVTYRAFKHGKRTSRSIAEQDTPQQRNPYNKMALGE